MLAEIKCLRCEQDVRDKDIFWFDPDNGEYVCMSCAEAIVKEHILNQ